MIDEKIKKQALELPHQERAELAHMLIDSLHPEKEFDKSLSYDFIHEFETSVQYLLKFPKAGHPYLHQTKRIFIDRFPYAIVYKIYRNERIVVYAIMHMKREPGYWEKRLE